MQLSSWQQNFVDNYLSSDAQQSLLVARPGTGKTLTALSAAMRKIENGDASRMVVVSNTKELQKNWAHIASIIGMDIDIGNTIGQRSVSITYQSLNRKKKEFREFIKEHDSIIILDEVAHLSEKPGDIGKDILLQNPKSKLLWLSSTPVKGHTFDWTHEFGREFIYQPEIIKLPETKIEIARYSPSILLLNKVQDPNFSLEGLSWRQFEFFISKLLESDGYDIKLMNGTKDGGVDIVAVKDMKEAGLFKVLWQAKKYKVSNKVGIAAIRELADVRNDFGASKGVLVTSSFLTRGALKRVHRDKYILGKVDRNDLSNWIDRKLFE